MSSFLIGLALAAVAAFHSAKESMQGFCPILSTNRALQMEMNCEKLNKIVAAAAMFALAACGINRGSPHEERPLASTTEPAEAAPQTFAIGLQLTPSGAIAQDSTSDTFARGNVIFLAVDVSSASADQKIDVEWNDARGRVLHTERRTVPPSVHYAAFSSGKTSGWRPGPYRAMVSINGRRVSELPFALM